MALWERAQPTGGGALPAARLGGFDMAERINGDLNGKDLRSRTRSSESEAESNKLKLA